jgi:hypothetical protein
MWGYTSFHTLIPTLRKFWKISNSFYVTDFLTWNFFSSLQAFLRTKCSSLNLTIHASDLEDSRKYAPHHILGLTIRNISHSCGDTAVFIPLSPHFVNSEKKSNSFYVTDFLTWNFFSSLQAFLRTKCSSLNLTIHASDLEDSRKYAPHHILGLTIRNISHSCGDTKVLNPFLILA